MGFLFNISIVRQNNAIDLSMWAITIDFISHTYTTFLRSQLFEIHELCDSIAFTNLYIVYVAIV